MSKQPTLEDITDILRTLQDNKENLLTKAVLAETITAGTMFRYQAEVYETAINDLVMSLESKGILD